MARPHIEPFVDTTVSFKRMTLPGFSKGMHYKTLSLDVDTGACSLMAKFEAGYKRPPGLSYTETEMMVTAGKVRFGDVTYEPGQYFFIPAGVSMPALSSSRGFQALMFFNYAEPSFEESAEDHERAIREGLVSVNAYEDLDWIATPRRAPGVASGCLVKVLRQDPLTKANTFLYCMTPKFRQDNISYHDCTEEGYHIFGTSWMLQFGDLPTGGYFWRPPYINHGAFASQRGCLALGRTGSELFNYFHFNPWTSPQENRDRAIATLHREKPELYEWTRAVEGHNHPVDFEHPHYHEHD